MPLGTFVVGAYTGTFDSVALGITDEGYELSWEPRLEAIQKSDVYGDAMIDTIYRGVDYFCQTEFMEYKAGPIDAALTFAALGVVGVIGRLGSNEAEPLVLTATTGTPAAAAPASLTAPLAILAPGSNPRMQFNSRLRTIPVRFVLLPSVVTPFAQPVAFTTT